MTRSAMATTSAIATQYWRVDMGSMPHPGDGADLAPRNIALMILSPASNSKLAIVSSPGYPQEASPTQILPKTVSPC
jgi:hypothetical protein